jgi:hypothetical protein
MSVNVDEAVEYRNGLRNPKTGFPAATRRSLIRAMIDAKVGADALVPPSRNTCPSTTISKFHPCVATSGYPRPVLLKIPVKSEGIVSRNPATAAVW